MTSPTGYDIPPPANGWRWSRERIDEKIATGEITFSPDGRRLIRKTYLADQGGLAPSTLWADIEETGHNRQAKYELKRLFPDRPTAELFATPKPERLVKRILEIATDPGDWVLDSFAGSGTTGAVAHKMRRRWIMIELGAHCQTEIIPRLTKVIDGVDPGGVSQLVGWSGGGGFRYFRLAPSLLQRDRWGNLVINREYNPEMLAEAVCKHMGFTYSPSETVYWQHGHSTESDFIYVTTQTLTHEQIASISEEVGEDRSLLVCCAAYRGNPGAFENLTVEKIPNAVLNRCEWGRDDYSLNVASLPAAPLADADGAPPNGPSGTVKKGRSARRSADAGPALVFDLEGEA